MNDLEELKKRFYKKFFSPFAPYGQGKWDPYAEPDSVWDFIEQAVKEAQELKKGETKRIWFQKGVNEENNRWMNQAANDHDNKIREDERKRVVEEIEEMKHKVGPSKIDSEVRYWHDGYNKAIEDILQKLK